MRISDWSSDVCSSDLLGCRRIEVLPAALAREQPRAMLVVERARERPLGGRVAQHRISLAAKLLLPLGIGLGDGKAGGGLSRPAARAERGAQRAEPGQRQESAKVLHSVPRSRVRPISSEENTYEPPSLMRH